MDRTGPNPQQSNDITLETERLVIAPPDVTDTKPLYELVGGEHRETICQYLIWDGPDSIDDTRQWVERCRTQTFGDHGFHWVIRDRSGTIAGSDQPLGIVGTRPSGPPGRADVGYWLGVPFWRKGVMREALTAVIDLGFGGLRYHKIEAEIFAFNTASRALVESLGFTLEGVARASIQKRDRWVDDAQYGMLHHEWTRP